MPKTQINYQRELRTSGNVGPDEPGTVEYLYDPIVNVNWRNCPEGTGHVQLSLDVPVNYLKMALESQNGILVSGSSLVWSPVLDRGEINRMIQALRKARDGAYGADA